ncbi:hydroxymethylpyrimidine/phosphomethylpyrimidine kinase [Pedobacter sp. HMWF019]|uniref:hydroxymethylpyrimidine/phosphomethylpyrimidine kinase n=1 Tax=Pedobacter sp. HMWF019 TaxID=2056856 RepID=UPI0013048D55|nr:hydroxymethylpyrimidine/phosphomethylpyrimidine kinase [Pedobacter sp. HMWF019]
MEYSRPIVMSIAGLDPSGGAGILADIKTFEQHKCLGFGVASALTSQTENRFIGMNWIPLIQIQEQITPLLEQYRIEVIKIGIIKNLTLLRNLVKWLRLQLPNVKLIWDPVASASTGFSFMSNPDGALLQEVLNQIYLLCPNTAEAQFLTGMTDEQQAASQLSKHCNVLLKGGHSIAHKGTDMLYSSTGVIPIFSTQKNLPQKHGSGCILSSAIAANMACKLSLYEACIAAKNYIEKALNSNLNLLAYHA